MGRAWLILALLVLNGCSKVPPATELKLDFVALERATVPKSDYQLWPRPKRRQSLEFEGLEWDQRLAFHGGSEAAQKLVKRLFPEAERVATVDEAQLRLGVEPKLTQGVTGAYRLEVKEGTAELVGHEEEGLFYAIWTFHQLAHKTKRVEAVRIDDWPSLPRRGLLLHTGANSGPTHRRLMERVMGPLKMNLLMIECEYARWESHPELWVETLSIPKEELAKTVSLAQELKVEVVPLIQTLSHMGWFFQNDQNQAAGEASLNYCFPPDDERAWKIVFDLYEEAIELFKPTWMNLGFDEVRGRKGVFPGSQKPVERVIIEHGNRLHDYLKERGVNTMIWADMLLTKEETGGIGFAPSAQAAERLRREMNKEIMLIDWQYEVGRSHFGQVPLLTRAGFRVLGATCVSPFTEAHARALAEADQEGLLMTTWPGRILNEQVVVGTEYAQFSHTVVAAEAAWNGGANEVDEPGRHFRWLWHDMPEAPAPRPGRAVRFQGTATDFSAEPQLYHEVFFAADQRLEIQDAVALPLNSAATGVAFLWTLEGEEKKGAEVARLHCLYQDGEQKTAPIRMQKELTDGKTQFPLYDAPVAWNELRKSLRHWTWTNPRPAHKIQKLILEPVSQTGKIHLQGVTVID